jgi:hypothetical protein
LKKYRRWLPVIVCIITLIPIRKVFATHHSIQFLEKREYTKPNINALIEKWMPSDMLWAPRSTGSLYVMRTKGNEEYIFEIIESKEFWFIVMIPKFYGNQKIGSNNRIGYKRETRIYVWSLC